MMSSVFHVVIATPDAVGERMAGPGIRAWHFAREIAKVAPVSLVAQLDDGRDGAMRDGVRLLRRRSPEAAEAIRDASVLIGQPVRGFFKRRRGQRVIFDLFDPVVLELRELYGNAPSLRQRIHLAAEWARLTMALRHGDALIAATDRQRDFYGRLQSGDARWLDVPFGIDFSEMVPVPAHRENVVVWGGGVWEWLDPKSAIDAVVRLNRDGLPCRLLFMGRSRPNPHIVDRRRESRFEAMLADGGEFVEATDAWVPYRERLAWLGAGKVAIMLHRPTPEAEYSIRTRLFDALAASLPVVATEQGFAADLVRSERIGIVVPPNDSDAVAAAIRRLLTDDGFHAACVANIQAIRPRFAWEVVTRPLVDVIAEWQTQSP